MKTIVKIDRWDVPSENQGQIVEVAYGLDPDAELIVRRTTDRSDGSVKYQAFEFPSREWEWDPWNRAPALGAEIDGEIEVE